MYHCGIRRRSQNPRSGNGLIYQAFPTRSCRRMTAAMNANTPATTNARYKKKSNASLPWPPLASWAPRCSALIAPRFSRMATGNAGAQKKAKASAITRANGPTGAARTLTNRISQKEPQVFAPDVAESLQDAHAAAAAEFRGGKDRRG